MDERLGTSGVLGRPQLQVVLTEKLTDIHIFCSLRIIVIAFYAEVVRIYVQEQLATTGIFDVIIGTNTKVNLKIYSTLQWN